MPNYRWDVIYESVQGASHKRTALPNQDAITVFTDRHHLPVRMIVAVADGHGSPASFRSDRGADFAVKIATDSLSHILEGMPGLPKSYTTLRRQIAEKLPREIVYAWRKQVDEHLAGEPFMPAELEQLEIASGEHKRRVVESDPHIAYGTTLLAVLVTAGCIIYLQIGDGDIVTVSEAGEASRPLPRDVRLIGNETTSLCSAEAWRHVSIHFQIIDEAQVDASPPALILVSTDGYANAFRTDENFLMVGPDILQMLKSASLEMVRKQLPDWLEEASALGSGDDITLGLLVRTDCLPATQETHQA